MTHPLHKKQYGLLSEWRDVHWYMKGGPKKKYPRPRLSQKIRTYYIHAPIDREDLIAIDNYIKSQPPYDVRKRWSWDSYQNMFQRHDDYYYRTHPHQAYGS